MNWALLLGFVPLLLSCVGCTQHLVHLSLMLLLLLQLSLLHLVREVVEVLPAPALASPSWPSWLTFSLCLFGQLLSLWISPTRTWRSCHPTWKPTLCLAADSSLPQKSSDFIFSTSTAGVSTRTVFSSCLCWSRFNADRALSLWTSLSYSVDFLHSAGFLLSRFTALRTSTAFLFSCSATTENDHRLQQ